MKITKEELIAAAIELAKKVDEFNKSQDIAIRAGAPICWIDAIRIDHNTDTKTFSSKTKVEFFIGNDDPIQPGETLEEDKYFRYAKRQEEGITIVRNIGCK